MGLSPLQITLIIFQLLALIILTRLIFFQAYMKNDMMCIHYSKNYKTYSTYAIVFLHVVIAIELYELFIKISNKRISIVSIQTLVYSLELLSLITLTSIYQIGVNNELRHEGKVGPNGEEMGELCMNVSNNKFIAIKAALVVLWTGLTYMLYTKIQNKQLSKEELFRELFNVY